MAENTSGNNVWASIFGTVVGAVTDVQKARIAAKTQAAPAGKPVDQQKPNVPPGTLGPYPQAEGKGGASMIGQYGQYFIYAILGIIVLAGLSMVRGK